MLICKHMGFFSSKPKRVTHEEWREIFSNLYGKLEKRERDELEKFFRADLNEEGIQSGITRAEFESGMNWLRQNTSKHEFEENDLKAIEEAFEKHLKD